VSGKILPLHLGYAAAATDSTIRALAGLIKLVGPADGSPMYAPDFQTGILAGLWGFIAAASSVLGRMQDGNGRSMSLSIFESSIAVTEYIMFEGFARGGIMRRIGINRFWPTFPVGIYETKEGLARRDYRNAGTMAGVLRHAGTGCVA
jgi:crotonobetainyl-CoA:carnitine CoA-transferase CaiB-like acyl-CoA transferase